VFLIVEDDVDEGAVNFQRVVIVDEAEFAEPIHEEADSRPRGSHHLRQHLLTDLGQNGFWPLILTEVCQQKEDASQPFFAGVEELVDQVLSTRLFRSKR